MGYFFFGVAIVDVVPSGHRIELRFQHQLAVRCRVIVEVLRGVVDGVVLLVPNVRRASAVALDQGVHESFRFEPFAGVLFFFFFGICFLRNSNIIGSKKK